MRFRFDAPDGAYGVCYLGTSFDCAFVETIYPTRIVGYSRRIVSLSELRDRYLAEVRLTRPLRLAEFAGHGMVQMGVDTRITGGDDYHPSQAWSQAVHERDPASDGRAVDGILYPARHASSLYSVALFERARSAVAFKALGSIGDPASGRPWKLMIGLCRKYGLKILQI
jgi:hypothetical protein